MKAKQVKEPTQLAAKQLILNTSSQGPLSKLPLLNVAYSNFNTAAADHEIHRGFIRL